MGVPKTWNTVEYWLDKSAVPNSPSVREPELFKKKFTNIPTLPDYNVPPEESFWKSFPKRALPYKASTRVNARNLEKIIVEQSEGLTKTELSRARRVVNDLKLGADACQKKDLPPIQTPNAKTAIEYGELLTDKIAGWIESGFVAGPFDSPPLPGFRANPLMAVVRNGKVRPVLNMSGPPGRSFNDNVDKSKLEKVSMNTAKDFGFQLKEAGTGATFSKFDYCDAYKAIPAKTRDFRLQGFVWLGKFFIETQQTFGGIPSVCNFDREGNTIKTLAVVKSSIPRNWVLRILDDTSCIAPKDSKLAEEFGRQLKDICNHINMPLAKNCKNNEKAFESQTNGTVMGVVFDSNSMTWALSTEKAEKIAKRCLDISFAHQADLKQLEKCIGSVNDLGQMLGFTKFFKNSALRLLQSFEGNYNILRPVSETVRQDMLVLAKMALSASQGLPLQARPAGLPLSTLTLYCDAAGASYTMVQGQRQYHNNEFRGVACIAGDSLDGALAWSRLSWPEGFVTGQRDAAGKYFGSKTTTLESIGLLIPFLAFPDLVAGRFIVFKIDNIAVSYGWQNGYVKFDETASEILKAVSCLAAYAGTKLHVDHMPRKSDKMSSMADYLSRCLSHDQLDYKLFKDIDSSLVSWLKNPACDGSLAVTLLRELQCKLPYV